MRAVVYVRQSLDRKMGTEDEGLAVARQREDCEKLCAARDWTVEVVIEENDTSATSAKPRPGFLRMLDMVDAGVVDVVVCWHVDRLVRRLTELEDIIARCERAGVRLATVSGDLDLSTDAGRLVGRILASVARGEIERKSARQKRAYRQRADSGQPARFSHVPFGYFADRVTAVPTERKAVSDACATLLSGGSLRSIAGAWNADGIATRQGAPRWTANTVRAILAHPRVAGLATFGETRDGRPEEIGVSGTWAPLVPVETFRAVQALLDDPTRRTTARGIRTLLGGLALCRCGAPAFGGRNSRGQRAYRCRDISDRPGGRHIARKAEEIDDYLTAVVTERLARPDAVELLRDDDRAGPDVDELRAKARALRARLDEIAVEFADGTIPAAMVRTMTERTTTALAEVDASLADAGKLSVLGGIVGAPNVPAAWAALDLDRRRAVVDALVQVTILSPGRGARVFDPASVQITPRVAP